jgi:hypothetical protein
LACNGCGRLELSYPAIVRTVYRNFKKPPSETTLWDFFEEYARNFLVILYQAEGGTWWAQFVASEKYLPRYKTARDQASPAPPKNLVEQHQNGYIEWKRAKSVSHQRFQKYSKISGNLGEISAAVAVADAVANKASPLSPAAPPANLFAETWNRLSGALPKIEKFSDSRRKKVHARIRQGITLEKFEHAVRACAEKPFLRGEGDAGWTASFDWLIKNDTNIERVITEAWDVGSPTNGYKPQNSYPAGFFNDEVKHARN